MSDKATVNRETLLKITSLVRPALASAAYIPALTHIHFDGDHATAYNDIAAISVKAKVDVEACLPGELLIKALNSFGAAEVMFQSVGENALVISSGRSKLKMPVLPVKAFPLQVPDVEDEDYSIKLDRSIMKGIDRCLMSVGNDPTHPAQMGVTLDVDTKGNAVLYSTDNFSISRYQTSTKIKLLGDSPVILPTFFCQQLVILEKAFPDDDLELFLPSGALLCEIGKSAMLFSKTMVDLEPLDFSKIIDRMVMLSELKEMVTPLPSSWDSAFSRALLVLSGEVDKLTKITPGSESIKLHSSSSMGDSDDSMSFDQEDPPTDAFFVDPSLILRGSKTCSHAMFTGKVTVLTDADAQFVHLVAHCAK